MRALLSTIGSRGDVQPLVALALELRALGHEVRLCVPPDFRDWIEGFGFSVTPIGPQLRQMTAAKPSAAGPMTAELRRTLAEGTVTAQFETVSAAAQGCDIVVAATALQIAARSVAEKIGVPYVFVAYCPIVLPSVHHPPPALPPLPGQPPVPATTDNRELWAQDAERFNDLFGAVLNSHRASLGLGHVSDLRSHIFGDQPWLASDPTLGPWPDRGDTVVQTGAWILPDERPLPVELEEFLESGEPPVYFGFGSIRAPQGLSNAMVDSARALGRRAIVSRGWADLSLTDNAHDCLSIGDVNLQALLPRVAAAVHHGGAGTTTTAAMAGAPQVVIPQVYDQSYWAQRVEELGIGAAHAPGTPTAKSLTPALEQALRPNVTLQAQAIAAAVRRDGARDAAERAAAAAS